jgi:hypothetical protein
VDDLGYYGMFSIWFVPEERWITVWDFLRKNQNGLEDALPVFLNATAAKQAVQGLDPILRPHCLVRAIVIDPPSPECM